MIFHRYHTIDKSGNFIFYSNLFWLVLSYISRSNERWERKKTKKIIWMNHHSISINGWNNYPLKRLTCKTKLAWFLFLICVNNKMILKRVLVQCNHSITLMNVHNHIIVWEWGRHCDQTWQVLSSRWIHILYSNILLQ
jgi:hypothetical protein